MGRALAKESVPAGVLARWAEDRRSQNTKFLFLKEWVADPSWGKVTLSEEHLRHRCVANLIKSPATLGLFPVAYPQRPLKQNPC